MIRLLVILGFLSFISPADMLPSIIDPNSNMTGNNVTSGSDVCYTKACNDTAASILRNMDKEVNPCDNFYKYACGNYLNTTEIPADQYLLDSFSVMKSKVDKQLNQSLNANNNNDKKSYRLVRNFYKSCMNTEKIEAIGVKDVSMKIKSMGGWPVVDGDTWNETGFSWLNATYKSHQFGYKTNYLIKFDVDLDLKTSSKRNIKLSTPKFLATDYADVTNDIYEFSYDTYVNSMAKVAKIFGAKADSVVMEMLEAFLFETKIIQASVSSTVNVSMTISQLNNKYPSIPWLEYINAQLPASLTSVGEDEVVIVDYPEYFERLETLLTRTPKREIANYFMWRIALESLPYLNEDVRVHKFDNVEAAYGMTKPLERWQECIDNVAQLGTAIGSVYVRDHFNLETKNHVLDMIKRLKENLTYILQENTWMDVTTKTQALAKVDVMLNYTAYTEELLDDKKLDEYYNGLELSEDSYLENVLKIQKFKRDKKYAKLRDRTNRGHWTELKTAHLNAFYEATSNTIYVPAPLTQDDFFQKDRPMYVNYGMLGIIIGHEMYHGFTAWDLFRDKNGSFIEPLEKAKKDYVNLGQCIDTQYSNYTVKEINSQVIGWKTRDENMADIGGLKLVYDTYIQWAKDNGEEKKLPGINRSPKELFWLITANGHCAKYKKQTLLYVVKKDNHCPEEFRVIGSFANNPEFARDYNCPLGSQMNPRNRCNFF